MTQSVLLPKPKYGDGASRRRRYEGSSLAFRDGWLFWTPAGGGMAGRWQLQVGATRGLASRLAHVQADLLVGARGGSIVLDRYVLLDSAGSLLASFPADRDGSGLSGPNPWFQVDQAASFASATGLTFEQVRIDGPQELATRFPGLYKHTRLALWMTYANALIYALGGLLFMGLAVSSWIDLELSDPSLGWVLAWSVGIFVVGLVMSAVGVLLFPPVFRRVIARVKRRHPERFPPRR